MKVKTYRPTHSRLDWLYWWKKLTFRNPWVEKPPRIRVDYWDTWDIASALAPIIVELLKQYKTTTHGYPANFVDEYREEEWRSKEEFDAAVENGKVIMGGEEAWLRVVDKMIFAFEHIADESWEEEFHSGEIDFITENGYLEYGPNHTHHFDRAGYMKVYEEIQEGVDLFAKYFRRLWD